LSKIFEQFNCGKKIFQTSPGNKSVLQTGSPGFSTGSYSELGNPQQDDVLNNKDQED